MAPIVKIQGKFIKDLHSALGYARFSPDTKANHDFWDGYTKRFGFPPHEYVWRGYTAGSMIEGAVKKAGSTDTERVIQALEKDLTVVSHIGVGPRGDGYLAQQRPSVDQLCLPLGGIYPSGALFHQRTSGVLGSDHPGGNGWAEGEGWLEGDVSSERRQYQRTCNNENHCSRRFVVILRSFFKTLFK